VNSAIAAATAAASSAAGTVPTMPATSPDVTCLASSAAVSASSPARDTAGGEAARSDLRQHGTECGDPDQQADKPRRSGEARSHAGALRRDRALHHLRRLTVEQPGAGTGDQHADKKSRIGQGEARERPQQQVADQGRH
jgi:hypothetical protein